MGNQRSSIPMKAVHGAEKSLHTRRKGRGLRRGSRRSRGCQPRDPVPPATNPKAPSIRVVTHRRRPMKWVMDTTYTFSQKCKVYAASRDWPCRCTERSLAVENVRCKACQTRKKMKQYLLVKWTRLHDRYTQLCIPEQMGVDSSFWRFMRREFGETGVVYERSILRGSFPFRWIDPIDESGASVILPSRPKNLIVKKTTRGARRGKGVSRPSVRACRSCGYVGPDDHVGCKKRPSGFVPKGGFV